VIPLRDENPARTTPYIVYILIAANVLVYLYNGSLGPHAHNPLAGFELVPAQLFGSRDLGAPGPVAPWMTIFTSMFMHANLFHVGGNMLYLWIFGNNIEDILGHFKFTFFYLASGLAAALAQVAANPMSHVPMVGASGAIAGVLGAYFLLFPRARIISLVILQVTALPAWIVLGFWIVLQVINSTLMAGGPGGGVAYAAHIGGFLAGILMILLLGGGRLLLGRQTAGYRSYRW
jgi:membrane associated rhomboid family serine protease